MILRSIKIGFAGAGAALLASGAAAADTVNERNTMSAQEGGMLSVVSYPLSDQSQGFKDYVCARYGGRSDFMMVDKTKGELYIVENCEVTWASEIFYGKEKGDVVPADRVSNVSGAGWYGSVKLVYNPHSKDKYYKDTAICLAFNTSGTQAYCVHALENVYRADAIQTAAPSERNKTSLCIDFTHKPGELRNESMDRAITFVSGSQGYSPTGDMYYEMDTKTSVFVLPSEDTSLEHTIAVMDFDGVERQIEDNALPSREFTG